ncbi:hypothetical protein, conserved [Eimeria necatrix]|uniref:Uncharacterized protein n=1 Tax=Eimeria necatrix TaxID=51315 RepID=U6MUL3_9EIME|nr:hypothetical protein, conserved [Eimeria necatrix]CDJ65375.1 hypothetical protein, conserved [Eimeria necatrix]
MLHHSASAVCLPGRQQGSPLGSRTFSTSSIGGNRGNKIPHGTNLETSFVSSSSTRLGVSDEDTCSRSDASSCPTAHMQPACSFMVSRRGSAEAFEDALESFDASQTSPGFTADYSSFVFTGKLPLRGGRHNQSGTASSIASLKSKAVEFPKEEAAAQAHEASGCSNSAGVSTGSSSRVGRDSTAREVLRGSLVRSPAPRLKAESGTARQPHYQAQKQQQKLPMKQGAEGLPVIDSRKVEESRRSARAASECQRGSVASPHCTYHSVSSSSEGKSARCPSSVAASQGLSGVEKPRRAIGRYSSVPAFSAADRLRIDRFKEGLPQCLSTQEAILKQQGAAEKKILSGRSGELSTAVFDATPDLGESVDWRSLLDAAGLGDVVDDEITLEADELHAKLQEFAPRSGPSWCLALLGCLWQWRL